MDIVEKIMRFESDELEREEIVPFFQQLVDTGLAWKLQGSYGRAASRLIEAGVIEVPA